MQQLRSAPARARHLRAFARLCLGLLALAGCDSPTWVVLRSRAPDAGTSFEPDSSSDAGAGAAAACKRHSDCAFGSVCAKYQCVTCERANATSCPASCPWKFSAQPFKRNGCALCECAPPNVCTSDLDCAAGLRCYRGQQCQDQCTDLACCFGNFCSPPGCEDPPVLGCDIVGCADGTCSGDAACVNQCKCDGKAFECANVNCPAQVCTL